MEIFHWEVNGTERVQDCRLIGNFQCAILFSDFLSLTGRFLLFGGNSLFLLPGGNHQIKGSIPQQSLTRTDTAGKNAGIQPENSGRRLFNRLFNSRVTIKDIYTWRPSLSPIQPAKLRGKSICPINLRGLNLIKAILYFGTLSSLNYTSLTL